MENSLPRNRLDPREVKELEGRLRAMHGKVAGDLETYGDEIRQEIPQNFKDALSLKEEIEIIEKEDEIEEGQIHMIEDALQRIADGSFGTCMDCGKAIPIERLRALPYARYCVPCEEKREKPRH